MKEFRALDKDGDIIITRDRLKQVFINVGENYTNEEEVDELWRESDTNGPHLRKFCHGHV